jgi:hypothetical protein
MKIANYILLRLKNKVINMKKNLVFLRNLSRIIRNQHQTLF